MQVLAIDLFFLSIPLTIEWPSIAASAQVSQQVLIRIQTHEGSMGYGEACPPLDHGQALMPRAIRDLQRLAVTLKGHRFSHLAEIEHYLHRMPQASMSALARAALEMALLDAFAKEEGWSLMAAMGRHIPPQVSYACPLPLIRPRLYERFLILLRQLRCQSVVIYVNGDLGRSLSLVRQVQDELGHDVHITLDVGENWTLPLALRSIPALLMEGVKGFRNILSRAEESNMEILMKRFGAITQLIGDQSVENLASVRRLLSVGWYNTLSLSLGKQGGIYRSLAIYQEATSAGVACQLRGHMGETALSTASGLLLKTMAPQVSLQEGGLGTYLLEQDIGYESLQMRPGGCLYHPGAKMAGPGLGVMVDEEALAPYLQAVTPIG